jgi:hypothetical protein
MTRVYSGLLCWSDGVFVLPCGEKKTTWFYLDTFFAKKQVFQEVAGGSLNPAVGGEISIWAEIFGLKSTMDNSPFCHCLGYEYKNLMV